MEVQSWKQRRVKIRKRIRKSRNRGERKGESESQFKTGDLYEDSIDGDGHRIDALAEVEVDRDRLILKDVAIYSNEGDIPNQIGTNEFKTWLDAIKK